MGIGYAATALTVPVIPAVLKICGRKITMVLGGVVYIAFILTYINPEPGLIYTFSFIGGIGGSLLWIAQVGLLSEIDRSCSRF